MQVFKNNVSLEATPTGDTHIVNKAYLEDRISKINVQHAVRVDELPICTDNGDGTYTISYVKDGTAETTTDTSQWFYYLDDNGNLKQTIFLEGEELTIDGAEIALDDYVEKEAFENTINELEANFQDGVDTLYDTCVGCGATPTDKTPTAIAEAIKLLSKSWWVEWVTLGGISTDTYSSLDDVLDDVTALDILMRKHNSVDYLIDELSSNAKALDIIVNDENAMQYIGTYDYCADKMLASNVIAPKLLESTHWQYILKDHVPKLTSNTSGGGIASAYNYTDAYKFFDKDTPTAYLDQTQGSPGSIANMYIQYKFPTPICIKKVGIFEVTGQPNRKLQTARLQYSNDGATWTTYTTLNFSNTTVGEMQYVNAENTNLAYGIYWRLQGVSTINAEKWILNELDFFGRSLNVSVPTMTGNTAPEGECFGSNDYYGATDSHYKAFDKTTTVYWSPSPNGIPFFIGYDFKKDVMVKYVSISNRDITPTHSVKEFDIQAYDSKNAKWITLLTSSNNDTSINGGKNCVINNNNAYQKYRVYVTSANSTIGCCNVGEIQFYGVDYSE